MSNHTGLGFYDLMNIAEQNNEETQRKSKGQQFVSYTPSAAKKLDPKQKKLSENVQKFLAKKEEEKRLQLEEVKRKRENLLELRSHDKKATRRVGKMLRMTKSANKCLISNAINCLNDSLVEQGGYQPDEDDYGYVSQFADDFHKKMMEKYKAIPISKPVRENVSMAVPAVQSLKSSSGSNVSTSRPASNISELSQNNHSSKKKEPKKKEPKKAVIPPINFTDLMQLAKEKCKEPVLIKKPKLDVEEEKFEFGRPMTAKEKAEYLREKAIRERINVPNFDTKTCAPTDRNNNKHANGPAAKAPPSFKIPNKIVQNIPESAPTQIPLPTPVQATPRISKLSSQIPDAPPSRPSTSVQRTSEVPNRMPSLQSNGSHNSGKLKPLSACSSNPSRSGFSNPPPKCKNDKELLPRKGVSSSSALTSKSKITSQTSSEHTTPKNRDRVNISKKEKMDADKRPVQLPPLAKIKSEFDQNGSSVKQHPYQNGKVNNLPHGRDRREQDVRPLDRFESRPKTDSYSSKSKPNGRQIIDSDDDEEDCDSEMDDFIDDTDMNAGDISDMIRQITGYDKSRYKNDANDECMESSAYEQMREENRSLRIGIQEDLEDMRLEAEEKKLKETKKKKRKN